MASSKNKFQSKKLGSFFKGIAIYALVGLAALIFLVNLSSENNSGNQEPVSQVVSDVKAGKIDTISVDGDNLEVKYKNDNKTSEARKEQGESIYQILKDGGADPGAVTIEVKDTSLRQTWLSILGTLLPIILTGALIFFVFQRVTKDAGQSIFSFGQSKAKVFSKDQPQIKFSDVAGSDEAKKELSEVVEFLKTPEKFRALGAKTPKGVLMVGPSGVGKTLMARAVAGEAGVPFFSIAGSEFMEILVGVGASVTGDTPILIRDNTGVRLSLIAEFVDKYYKYSDEEGLKYLSGIQTLGFDKEKNKFWGTQGENHLIFGSSAWKNIQAVYRHKVNQIYEIEYLGGEIRATGDHSVFIRRSGRIISEQVSKLKRGDLLVDLPLNIRSWDYNLKKTVHEIKSHNFPTANPIYLDFWNDDMNLKRAYEYITANGHDLSSYQLAQQIGVCQTTVLNWQKGVHLPRGLSKKLVKFDLPDKILITPDLMKLFGFYTAEGRGTNNLEFTFGSDEPQIYGQCIALIEKVFGIRPVIVETEDNSVKVKYYSAHLGRFFARHCGNGSFNKHLPSFIWDLPKEHFLAFLEGYSLGDGYISKTGKLIMCSVSHRLIQELVWLCAMHGIKSGVKHDIYKEGRIIRNKPLPKGEAWVLIIGKTSNPFLPTSKYPNQFKRAIVRNVTKKEYSDFVYDLCGVENEAFFGGEKPILLHNSRVRDLFAQAKKNAPAIIFIDEVESIGRMRGMGFSGGHDEREQTLNQILVEMDGFTPNDSIIIIAATNRPDMLDPALVRPGRFDRRVVLGYPDLVERKEILQLHMKGKPFTKDVDLEKLARRTVGFSGADLANMINEAAILAARAGKKAIEPDDLEEAATKVKLGPQRKRMQTEEDRKLAAYHEAGHAIVGHFLEDVDPVHRITIVARGMSGGHTMFPPTQDRTNESQTRLLEQIATALGGQAAEKLILNDISTGAASDLEMATNLARAMVTEYGMSDLGPMAIKPRAMFGLWARGDGETGEASPEYQNKVDEEVKKILDTGYKQALTILKAHKDKLEKVAKQLLEKETLESEEFEKIVGKKKLPNGKASTTPNPVQA